jgi:hypothetical protein
VSAPLLWPRASSGRVSSSSAGTGWSEVERMGGCDAVCSRILTRVDAAVAGSSYSAWWGRVAGRSLPADRCCRPRVFDAARREHAHRRSTAVPAPTVPASPASLPAMGFGRPLVAGRYRASCSRTHTTSTQTCRHGWQRPESPGGISPVDSERSSGSRAKTAAAALRFGTRRLRSVARVGASSLGRR